MEHQEVEVTFTGLTALLMHNEQLADPLNPKTKEIAKISSKRKKTDADHEEIGRLEWHAGLYLDFDEKQIVIPQRNLMMTLVEGARMTRSGPKIEQGLTISGSDFPLEYDGPSDPRELYTYANRRFVSRMTVKLTATRRIVRVRPIFKEWAVTFQANLDTSQCTVDDLREIAENAGRYKGMCDYRKAGGFGRYEATVEPLNT